MQDSGIKKQTNMNVFPKRRPLRIFFQKNLEIIIIYRGMLFLMTRTPIDVNISLLLKFRIRTILF